MATPTAETPLALDVRLLTLAELVAAKSTLDAGELTMLLRDGRELVRANAARGLGALGHATGDLVSLLRDGDLRVAMAAAEAHLQLGVKQCEHVVAIAGALVGARPPVVALVERMFAELVGSADAELVSALDTRDEVAVNAVVVACAQAGVRGLHLLQAAARDDRTRVRINALRGIARIGDLELESSLELLGRVERDDHVADIRAVARASLVGLKARRQQAIAAHRRASVPAELVVPELVERSLTVTELANAAANAPLDELLHALEHPRVHVRLNAVRVFAEQGAKAAASARAIAVLLRDQDAEVRREAARALGTLAAVVIAPELVTALGDHDATVVAAAEAAISSFGDAAGTALVAGLDTPNEPHGVRVATLLAKLADGPSRLLTALASVSLDVGVHAALGLAAAGRARAGSNLRALRTAALAGNPRFRAAATRALAVLDPRPETQPPRITIPEFYEKLLDEGALGKGGSAKDLAAHLADAFPTVRANAATALGAHGDAIVADLLGVALRDDAPAVRLAAARAIDRLGPSAVAIVVSDLVVALRTAEAPLLAQLTKTLQSHQRPEIDAALISALVTVDDRHRQRLCELVCSLPNGVELLCEAFSRSASAAAQGFVMLGRERLGKGRALLEAARANGSHEMRELARVTLRSIDGDPLAPAIPKTQGFETTLLDAGALAAGPDLALRDLLGCLLDGRAIVRANAATAIGSLGTKASSLARTIAALLRDDDPRVRIASARAIDQFCDDAVVATAADLVGGMRGDAEGAEACRAVLAARGPKVEAALVAGLETSDEAHGTRLAKLIVTLPDARETLFIAFDGPAQNVQLNAAIGIGLLGDRAGRAGWRRLKAGIAGPLTRRREVMVKALEMLGPEPAT
ncbi:hypothetical protein BH11MYX1_BH11MYX1_23950 [soil metagenome]